MVANVLKSDLDDPRLTIERRDVIEKKPFLRQFYRNAYAFYSDIARTVPPGCRVELGSGAGFAKEVLPDLVTSDVLKLPFVDRHFSAEDMPFEDGSLAFICMVDTLHHIPRVELFFREASRTLKVGGAIALQEPANTILSNFIYRNFHHEPFDTATPNWSFPSTGPLSSANGALPWIVFQRDRQKFESMFPDLRIESVTYCHPFLYILSGGFSLRQLLPGSFLPLVQLAERMLQPINGKIGLFTRIVVRKVR